jgi:hypothetical protein
MQCYCQSAPSAPVGNSAVMLAAGARAALITTNALVRRCGTLQPSMLCCGRVVCCGSSLRVWGCFLELWLSMAKVGPLGEALCVACGLQSSWLSHVDASDIQQLQLHLLAVMCMCGPVPFSDVSCT